MKKISILFSLFIIIASFLFFQSVKAEDLSSRLKGRILLQVESHGEAWYVNPKDSKRYYMANGAEAYNIMRTLGVGITNIDLEKIKGNKTTAKKHSGKIFLQVQSLGEAFYVDINGNTNYLKDGEAAYQIMRNLGLGIKTNDLLKIEASSKDISANSSLTSNRVTDESLVKVNSNSDCIRWDYSDWSTCDKDGNKIRKVLKSYPDGCVGGLLITMSSCAATCSTFSYSNWSDCFSDGTKTRIVIDSYPSKCINGEPVLKTSCNYVAPICSFNYSPWSSCSYGQQKRIITSKYPDGCSGENKEPLLIPCASPVIGKYADYETAYDFVTEQNVSIFSKTKEQWIENNKIGGYVLGGGHPLTQRWVNRYDREPNEWNELDRFVGVSHAFYPWEHAEIKDDLGRCAIKGNVSFDTGEKIYHLPDCDYYNETVINEKYGEKWFCSERDAIANGFRRAQNCSCDTYYDYDYQDGRMIEKYNGIPVKGVVDLNSGKINKVYPWEDNYYGVVIDNRFGGRFFCEQYDDIKKK